MTREELKNIVRHVFHFYDVNAENSNWTDMNEACGEILKILEQEPCEDCTSREDTMSMILCYGNEIKADVMDDIKASMIKLPSVTPQVRTGQWLSVADKTDWCDATYKCSCCGREIITPYELKNNLYNDYPFCHCGAKMEEKNESKFK